MDASGNLISMTPPGLLNATPRIAPSQQPSGTLGPSVSVCIAWLVLMAGANLATPLIACIYAVLVTAVVGSGLLNEDFSLTVAVAVVAAGLALIAAAVAVWHARVARSPDRFPAGPRSQPGLRRG